MITKKNKKNTVCFGCYFLPLGGGGSSNIRIFGASDIGGGGGGGMGIFIYIVFLHC